MPTYSYKNPKTNEIFEVFRLYSEMRDPYISPDGVSCEFIPWWALDDACDSSVKHPKGLVDRNCEVWDKDRAYIKSLKPKFVRTRSGKRIPYDPNSMG